MIYTLAFQFPDAAAVRRAEETIRSWLSRCAKTLQGDPVYRPRGSQEWQPRWVAVKSRGRTVAAFADAPSYHTLPESENTYFESVGITRAADRLAVTVEIAYGQDHDVSYVQDDTESGPHPQFAYLLAAARAISR